MTTFGGNQRLTGAAINEFLRRGSILPATLQTLVSYRPSSPVMLGYKSGQAQGSMLYPNRECFRTLHGSVRLHHLCASGRSHQ